LGVMTYVDPPIGDPPETVMIVSVPVVELFVAKEIVVPFCPGDATKSAATMTTTAVATTTTTTAAADVIAATFCFGDTRSILAATR
jgi:hypothetical protein